jgi:hypothetical protein
VVPDGKLAAKLIILTPQLISFYLHLLKLSHSLDPPGPKPERRADIDKHTRNQHSERKRQEKWGQTLY